MTTTAKREGDTWVLNGQKRWIGDIGPGSAARG
jgi:glutaryl-CoA dehydrogenase